MENWLVCAQGGEGERLTHELQRVIPQAQVKVAPNPFSLRKSLAESQERCSVLVGDPCKGVDAVNLAAALARDGHANQVVLAVRAPSGSLRSRASAAGLTRVIDLDEGLSELVPAARNRLSEQVPEVEGPRAGSKPPTKAQTPTDGTQAPVLCFVSGRGGVGKTTLVACTAALASSWGLDVACLDLDLAFGNLFSAFGLAGAADLSELALYASGKGGTLRREDVIPAGKEALDGVGLWGSCDLPEHAELVEPVVGDLIRHVCAGHDLVLIDTSPAWSDSTALAAQVADRLVLVSNEEAGGTSSLSRAAALAVRLGVTRSRIVRVTNRCEHRREEEDVMLRANVGLETARFYRLPTHPDAAELIGSGHAAALASDGSDFSSALGAFLAKTLEELGCLPDDPAAVQALTWREHKGRSWPFGR